jgi:hypothetical protein
LEAADSRTTDAAWRSWVLDAGALIVLERGSGRMLALVREVTHACVAADVTAEGIAQVWRGSPRQHALVRRLCTQALRVHPVTEAVACRVGLLLGSSGTSDVIDVHVARLGRSWHTAVVTSDPDDPRRVDPGLRLAPG